MEEARHNRGYDIQGQSKRIWEVEVTDGLPGWVQEWSGNGHEGTFSGYGSVLYLVWGHSSVVTRD